MFPLYGIVYLEAPSVYKTACVSVLCGWRCIVHGVVCVRVKYCGWSDLCVRVYVCRCLVWYVVQVSVVKSKHVSVMVCLSIDTTVCFLNQSLVLSLSHMRSHTHTYFPLIRRTFSIYSFVLLKVDASHIFAYTRSQWRVIFVFTTAALSGGPAMNSI